jgi:hypothetical protein
MVHVVFGLYVLPCVGSGVWRKGLALSMETKEVGFLPEDGS